MKTALKVLSGSAAAAATIVDGKLILVLPHALTPAVWQMDLGQVKASALEVRENALVLKTLRGETTEVAAFEKRSQAVDTLMTVARALENAHGQIRVAPAADEESSVAQLSAGRRRAAAPRRRAGKWLGAVAAVLLLVILLGLWGALLPRYPGSYPGAAIAPVGEDGMPVSGGASGGEAGVPQSADDVLGTE